MIAMSILAAAAAMLPPAAGTAEPGPAAIRDARKAPETCRGPAGCPGPNRLPSRSELARALVGRFECFDFSGITHCGDAPKRARVEAYACRPVAPGTEGRARAACRVTAEVRFSGLTPARRLRDECVRFERITAAEESPARWIALYVPGSVPCEVR